MFHLYINTQILIICCHFFILYVQDFDFSYFDTWELTLFMTAGTCIQHCLHRHKWYLHSCERSICTCVHNHWRWRKSWRLSNQVSSVNNIIGLLFSESKAYNFLSPLTHYLTLWCSMTEPQPAYSAYREASFGHAIFDIKNRTHAYYSWHRNQDGYAVEADTMWFANRYWHQIDDSPK